ncbi:MAG TPA: peptidase E [Bacillota bacterium]|nr:peptidase E [Bacillota bacterium]
MSRQIVAFGGGAEPMRLGEALEEWILRLTGRETPRICFLPTASGDSDANIVRFYQHFRHPRCQPSHLPLFRREGEDLRARLLHQDIIYVGGGNTANMLAIWRLHGVDAILREAWEAGILLCGGSAGSLCWYECGVTDSFGLQLAPLHDGLGLLPGSHCPHYDAEALRRPSYGRYVGEGVLPAGVAVDNAVALRYEGKDLVEVVTAKAGAQAYRVERTATGVHEAPLPARQLR